MYYAKQVDENGNIVALHSMDRPFPESAEFIPITESEYLALMEELVPEEVPLPDPDEISDSEALQIITGEVEA